MQASSIMNEAKDPKGRAVDHPRDVKLPG